jgi:hypothetical protein
MPNLGIGEIGRPTEQTARALLAVAAVADHIILRITGDRDPAGTAAASDVADH